eukprot:3596841-Pleurochrysis_carterae.AAC.1
MSYDSATDIIAQTRNRQIIFERLQTAAISTFQQQYPEHMTSSHMRGIYIHKVRIAAIKYTLQHSLACH